MEQILDEGGDRSYVAVRGIDLKLQKRYVLGMDFVDHVCSQSVVYVGYYADAVPCVERANERFSVPGVGGSFLDCKDVWNILRGNAPDAERSCHSIKPCWSMRQCGGRGPSSNKGAPSGSVGTLGQRCILCLPKRSTVDVRRISSIGSIGT